MITRRLTSTTPIHIGQTLRALQHGRYDPTTRVSAATAWRAVRTPDGAATARVTGGGHEVAVDAWGPGAPWIIEHAADLVGAHDDAEGFAPTDPIVAELHRRHPGMRVARSRVVLPLLVATIIGQRVTGIQAARSWASVARRFGEPAPGPPGLWLPPTAERLASLPYYRFHPLGIEKSRADTIRRSAAVAPALERLTDDSAALSTRLRFIPGVGPWTAALVAGSAAGDPDAVPIGDLHIPGIVCFTLTGEIGDDDRMLELLAPYAGHRGRVARLILLGGVAPSRHAARQALVQIARL